MIVRRRVFQFIPFIAIVVAVVSSRIIQHDPWRSNSFLGWLGADVYYPRYLSLLGDWVMVYCSLAADVGIAAGCGLIAYSYWVHRSDSIQLNSEAVRLIGGSIGLVGLTHLVNAATMYSGVFLLDLLVRSSAAAACCVTALYTAQALLSRRRR